MDIEHFNKLSETKQEEYVFLPAYSRRYTKQYSRQIDITWYEERGSQEIPREKSVYVEDELTPEEVDIISIAVAGAMKLEFNKSGYYVPKRNLHSKSKGIEWHGNDDEYIANNIKKLENEFRNRRTNKYKKSTKNLLRNKILNKKVSKGMTMTNL